MGSCLCCCNCNKTTTPSTYEPLSNNYHLHLPVVSDEKETQIGTTSQAQNKAAETRVKRGLSQMQRDADDKKISLKTIEFSGEDEGIPSTALREIGLLKQLQHPNIVKLFDVLYKDNSLTLAFEFFEDNLHKHISSFSKSDIDGGLPKPMIKSYLFQLLSGLNYCHKMKVLHRDLNPRNMLINVEDGRLKLCNFSFAREFGINVRNMRDEVVTLWYRPPDMLMGCKHYTTSVDMWSVGCVFSEMITGKALFPGKTEEDELEMIFKLLGTPTIESWPGMTKLPKYKPDSYPKQKGCDFLYKYYGDFEKEGIDLLLSFLEFDPDKRISASNALQHGYFKDTYFAVNTEDI